MINTTTFDDVIQLCIIKDIELLEKSEDWVNKKVLSISYFNIKAKICGHTKSIRYDRLKNDIGVNNCMSCTNRDKNKYKIPYNIILQNFEENNCILLTTEEEFINNHMNIESIYKYIGECTHECLATYKNFIKCNSKIEQCNICNNKINNSKIDIDLLTEFSKKNDGIYIEKEKINKKWYYTFECKNKHKFKIAQSEINKNLWCKTCDQEDNLNISNAVELGDSNELEIFNLIKDYCNTINIVGCSGSLYDIIYTLNDNIERGIQVKSLTKIYSRDNITFM
jgi:hypothetical protein